MERTVNKKGRKEKQDSFRFQRTKSSLRLKDFGSKITVIQINRKTKINTDKDKKKIRKRTILYY